MFGSLLSAAVRVVATPVYVAADVVTLGGALNDRDVPYTVSNLSAIADDIDDSLED